ncbi:MAG: integrase repeat-containing protein [Saprospiraceae bacterium]
MSKDISTWDDLMQKFTSLSKKEKGDAFENITKLYFEIDPKYQFYDNIWLFSELPAKELEILGLPSQDLGIDIIAKSGDEYHAIQCKFHDDHSKSITFKEVATFISLLESNPKLTQGYICSTADSTSHNFQKLKTKPINLILSDDWNNLGPDFFHQIEDILNGKKPTYKIFEPKEHQEKAIKDAVSYFSKSANTRGKLIFPCGSGKSLTGLWITQALRSKTTLIAVPSLSLIKQTLEVYLSQMAALNVPVKWLCICSDEGIGKDEDIVIYTENIGVPCQTDPVYIEQWLIKNKGENIIVFTTYQSGRIIAEISKNLAISFDVGIFDEAHKTVGSDKKLFSHLLLEENISISKRIFMTATERFYQGSDDSIISMNNTSIYGEVFTQMSFKEAIELNLLTDYKVITIEVGKAEISDFIKQNNLVQLNDKWKKETEARSLASMLALRKAMEQFPIKNAVSFHSSIDKAIRNKELQDHISTTYNFEPIVSYTVSGNQPTAKRNRIVQEFARSERALITNAKCLTEGVDVPNIDCIVFADPRKSKVDIVQALGRALRRKEGKEWGYVVLPVVYDEETKEIDNENFKEIVAILRGLASNDSRIIEYFEAKSSDKHTKSNKSDSLFNFSVISEILDEKELEKHLEIRLWDKLSGYNWLQFEEARDFARTLNLKNNLEWREYYKSINKSLNIPFSPDSYYKDKGWKNWSDWLGTGYIASQLREYIKFSAAKDFVHKLKLKSQKEWREYCKSGQKPEDIPKTPNQVYKQDGWNTWGDWLGTENVASYNKSFLEFKEARDFVQKLKLKSSKEWSDYCKSGDKPEDIPSNPNGTYKQNGWKTMGDWLGTGTVAARLREYKSFEEARNFVHKLKLKGQKEWKDYCKTGQKPENIPASPNRIYSQDGWKDWGDWLGTWSVATLLREYISFSDARDFVHKLNLKSQKEWKNYCKSGQKQENIPANPNRTYSQDGWKGWGDWLGTESVASYNKSFLEFEDAKKFVQNLKLNSNREWSVYCKSGQKPENIPVSPNRTYSQDGWKGMGDWLGTGSIASFLREYRPFEEARDFVHKLNLKSREEWQEYYKSGQKPEDIPAAPNRTYEKVGWKGMADWLGSGTMANQLREYKPFEEAREFVRKLKVKSQKEWQAYCKSGLKPDDIPTKPDKTYKKNGWNGFGDWLGSGTVAARFREYKSFVEAKEFVHKLKLNSQNEWRDYCKSGQKPEDIPSNPHQVYKQNGWKGFGDWLGY